MGLYGRMLTCALASKLRAYALQIPHKQYQIMETSQTMEWGTEVFLCSTMKTIDGIKKKFKS